MTIGRGRSGCNRGWEAGPKGNGINQQGLCGKALCRSLLAPCPASHPNFGEKGIGQLKHV